MSRMGEIHMIIHEMVEDGIADDEIARIVANDYDVDYDFALMLVDEIVDEIDRHPLAGFDPMGDYYGA